MANFGDAADRGEALIVLIAVGAERADIVQGARLEAEEIFAVDEVAMLGGIVLLGQLTPASPSAHMSASKAI